MIKLVIITRVASLTASLCRHSTT